MTTIYDVPLWKDHPFQDILPPGLEVRKGVADGIEQVVFWSEEKQRHVSMEARSIGDGGYDLGEMKKLFKVLE